MGKMVLGIASGNIEKLTAAGIILNGAVAQDMEVEVFLLLGGAYAFKKGNLRILQTLPITEIIWTNF